jgi:hypothetical protein
MPELEVIEHVEDSEAGVWRLVLGYRVRESRFSGLLGPGGEPIMRDEYVGTVPVEDIVFALDDPRWANREPEDVRAEQARIALEAAAGR